MGRVKTVVLVFTILRTRPFDWCGLPTLVLTAAIHEVFFRPLPEQHHQLQYSGGSCSRLVFLATLADILESIVAKYICEILHLRRPYVSFFAKLPGGTTGPPVGY